MSGSLISIAGVDRKMQDLLSSRAKIESLPRFWDATRTPEERAELARKTRIPLDTINIWAVQAELLRIDTMSYDMAYELMEADIRSVEQFKETSASVILEKLKKENPHTKFTEDAILKLQKADVKFARAFECTTVLKDTIVTKDTTPGIYSNLSNVIIELGKGVAVAQHELDQYSLDIQNKILRDDKLYGMGLQATWYVMPEVEFTMKMDYSVYEEKKEDGTITRTDVNMLPSNATYSNLFKSSKKEESSVKLKIVPIPAGDKFVARRYMPNLKNGNVSTIGELKSELERVGISAYKILPEDVDVSDDSMQIEVIRQDPLENKLLVIGTVPEIEIKVVKR